MMLADIFIQRLFDDPRSFFMLTFIVVFSVCLHEYSHAQVALWMGDSTAADRGHLTLNPLKQMGWFCIWGGLLRQISTPALTWYSTWVANCLRNPLRTKRIGGRWKQVQSCSAGCIRLTM